MTQELAEAGISSEVPASRMCSKCGDEPRVNTSTWGRTCLNEAAAVYRERTRPRIRREQRICALEGCEETYEWKSTHPKSIYCSKSHYMSARWREQHPRTPEEELAAGEKRCSKCREVKSALDFSPSCQCRSCSAIYQRQWAKENVQARSAATRRSKARKMLREYGAYTDDIDQIVVDQGGVCYLCDGQPGVKGFHIDHDHELHQQGRPSFRGLACHGCNVGVGALGDDPGRIVLVAERLAQRRAELREC